MASVEQLHADAAPVEVAAVVRIHRIPRCLRVAELNFRLPVLQLTELDIPGSRECPFEVFPVELRRDVGYQDGRLPSLASLATALAAAAAAPALVVVPLAPAV